VNSPSRPAARRSPEARLALEPLEARDVPATAFALLPTNALIAFAAANPAATNPAIPITGWGADETLVGIDFRPPWGRTRPWSASTSGRRTACSTA